MYKLLIVDDEIHAIKGIEASLNWSTLGITEIYSACNIRKAKEILEQYDISIMICDIEMPQGNGLELLTWIFENHLRIVSILLTCHAKFEYAQKAVSLGALDYLLKPVDAQKLESVVRRAQFVIEKMQESAQKRSEDHDMDGQELPLIISIKEYIKRNMSSDLTREKISLEFHFSPDYLSKIFKKETGHTLSDYLFEERIKIAKDLLTNTDMPISDIVGFIGYSNFSHFSKTLKNATGMTPLNYRKSKGKL